VADLFTHVCPTRVGALRLHKTAAFDEIFIKKRPGSILKKRVMLQKQEQSRAFPIDTTALPRTMGCAFAMTTSASGLLFIHERHHV
jgi:hypothetical protein